MMKSTSLDVVLQFCYFFWFAFICNAYTHDDPHYANGRTVMVHLFEWKYKDIANECEHFLGPNGYGGVQISPVSENIAIANRPWYERYQPISYLIATRSDTEEDLRDMVRRCNAVKVRVYVDAVLNHMAAENSPSIGTGGSTADIPARNYFAVPYTKADFHSSCGIQNYQSAEQVRNCELSGLPDLDHSKENVQNTIANFLNKLIDIGVAGFRIDAAKHMWPQQLNDIYGKIKNLTTSAGFAANSRPFIFQEVIDPGTEAVSKFEYSSMGAVTEFKFSAEIGRAFGGKTALKWLKNWGTDWGFLVSKDALVFVDNHDNQRGHGAGGTDILTYKSADKYKMAVAFMLAHPFGKPRIMSSYEFSDPSQGPPVDSSGHLITPTFTENGLCSGGWVCEHRWKEIANMVNFRNAVQGTELSNWWANGNNQIAFCRGTKGFVAFNGETSDLVQNLQTCLPKGVYCDIISGGKIGSSCSGLNITVAGNDGKAYISVAANHGIVAFYLNSKL